MARNPLLAVDALRRRHQREQTPWLLQVRDLALPACALLLLVPLARMLFLGFLIETPQESWPETMAQVALRFALVLIGWLALDTYDALIRSDDRDTLAILPVDPSQVATAALWRVARRRWVVVPACSLLLAPVALAGAPLLWAASVGFLLGAWVLGLTVSAAVHLSAVGIAEDPRFAGVLDLVRGNNPRAQAAFLYAPGVALMTGGALLIQCTRAIENAHDGISLGLLALPFAVAALIATRIPHLARGAWFRASAVLAEIDARYAALADPEEGRRVYMDWAIRWLPRGTRLYALDDLRHGWRARRTLITGAWLVGLAGVAATWTPDPAGPLRAVLVVTGGVWLCASVGVLLAADEPHFLRAWMPRGGTAAVVGRGTALAVWLQPCIVVPALATWMRHGSTGAGQVLLAGELAAIAAIALALICGRLAERGMTVYGPVAAVAAAGLGVTWVGSLP